MPNELIVGAIQPMTGPVEKPTEPKSEPFVASPAASPAESSQLFVNPTLKFDSTLGLLVIEFRDSSGNVSTSIPSQRQLEAYRLHEQPLPGHKQPVAHDEASVPVRGASAGSAAASAPTATEAPAAVATAVPRTRGA
jgi:hypothetical protein